MSIEQKGREPVMMRFKEGFERHKIGGEYDPQQQIRVVKESNTTVPYIRTKDIAGMGSTHTGERANEH